MIKLFKRLVKILTASLLVGLIVIIAVVTLIDPNEFKGYIEKHVTSHTGHTLTIKGPIAWHFSPRLSLEIYDLSLANAPTPSSTFLTLKKANIKPKFWSLFSGKLLVDLQLQELNVTLNRPFVNAVNWRYSYPRFFVPYNLTIEAGTLNWQDARTNQNFQVKDLHLSAKKLPLGATGFLVPISSSFHFENLTHNHSGHLSFNSEWCFNDKLQQFDIQNLELIADIHNFPATKLMGELHIQQFKNFPIIEGKLQAMNLGVERWFGIFNLSYSSLMPSTIDVKSVFKYNAPFLEVASFAISLDNGGILEGSFKTNIHPGMTLQTVNLNGTFHGKDLRIGLFPIQEIKTFLEAKEGVYHFNQMDAQFINSKHQGSLQIDVKNHVPQFSLSGQIDSADINELLTFLGEKNKISGRSQTKVTLTTQGTTTEEYLHNLSGQAHITLMNGKLRGISLSPLLQHAQSTVTMLTDTVLKKQSINIGAILTAELGEWKQQAINYQELITPFRLVETNMTIDHGKINASDFKLTHPEYTINGQGTIDLIHKDMEYEALALLSRTKPSLNPSQPITTFLKETPLSISVKGPLNNLSVNPDLAHYAEGAIKLIHKTSIETSKDNNNSLEKLFDSP